MISLDNSYPLTEIYFYITAPYFKYITHDFPSNTLPNIMGRPSNISFQVFNKSIMENTSFIKTNIYNYQHGLSFLTMPSTVYEILWFLDLIFLLSTYSSPTSTINGTISQIFLVQKFIDINLYN